MEIKATLNKPYTENQRLDFIVENNHQQGYEIKETETALEAWGLTEEERAEEDHKKELIAELAELDLKEIRPLAAKAAGTATYEDIAILADLEEQKAVKRQELQEL